jgi:holo-[acyl-carrier protein] synthase
VSSRNLEILPAFALALDRLTGALSSASPGAAAAVSHTASGETVVGLGVDIEEVERFRQMPFEDYLPFYQRFFSAEEIGYCLSRADPAQHFAARLAAKEAAVKAFSPLFELFPWQVEVKRDPEGRPSLAIYDFEKHATLSRALEYSTLVSLSHTSVLGAAVVAVFQSGE